MESSARPALYCTPAARRADLDAAQSTMADGLAALTKVLMSSRTHTERLQAFEALEEVVKAALSISSLAGAYLNKVESEDR